MNVPHTIDRGPGHPGPVTMYATRPPVRTVTPSSPPRRPLLDAVGSVLSPWAAAGLVVVLGAGAFVGHAGWTGELPFDAVVTLLVFLVAVWAWIFSPLDDTYVALGGGIALVVFGIIDANTFAGTLGSGVIWLLIGAFVIAAAVTASGLSARVSARVVRRARTPRQLVHLITAALLLTTFAIPATSGRAALALPIFLALAAVLRDRPRLVLCLALVFPMVILFSAVGSLLGAGAHLITVEIVSAATGGGIGFLHWAVLGIPLALVWSHLAAESALWLMTDRAERARPLCVPPTALATTGTATSGPLTSAQRRVSGILGLVVALWCSEPLHGVDPAIVAVLGALAASAPAVGATTLGAALKTVPWTLLLFMAATLALGMALNSSGAAEWLADQAFGSIAETGPAAAMVFVVVAAIVSLLAHLVIQSRSARSAVLIPIIVVTAPAVGVDPVAAAFLSTAAAGFCITLTSSAKPVAMFAASDDVPGYEPRHLLTMSALLAPVSLVLLIIFAFWVWPYLGLPLLSS
ncbi:MULTISPECIES: SLC13 family permease [unclassified Gordonia (in: high G+C Gram-positive bacteria)]|uniref:SLC13 family permease n=1 Tax=unclassified Gordonia (in: high G+C Gram-positive bacteria) TaxID=2657482 RepID=UPI00099110AB|nr:MULTISPECIES: SLC13 family permease [unclassified Gordonia (in: high G+C Gram-positive bacteria)]MCX2755102.1 SLC13 family permease [Gordonia sp. 4N]